MGKISRRKFIKNVIIMGNIIVGYPIFISRKSFAEPYPVIVHPNVDNLRVVTVTDDSMTRDHDPAVSWALQEELVNSKKVWENIDRLACGLVKTGNPEEAWRAIFLKPPGKSWSDTVVAIKTNNISQQHTRSAVITKICNVLMSVNGVKPHNIHIYDACHGESISRDTPFRGIPDGCRIENRWGGSTVQTGIPEPWEAGEGKSECLKYLTDGTVDILVNIALCKGHSSDFGGFTMTMKNHFGTFSPRPGHRNGNQDYLIAINKTPEILGQMDKRTGKVLFPRQQLCVVDALWSSDRGPGGNPTHQSNLIAFGVLSPAVDYQLATRFRQERMGWKLNMKMARRFIREFGYDEKDFPENGKLIEV